MAKTNEIKTIVTLLIQDALTPVEVENYITKIHTLFQDITKITGFSNTIEELAAVPAAKGKALGLNHAAQCLLDYKRTFKFLKAVVLAIKTQQENKPGELVSIFYAGCGPYAPFITLIAPLFKIEEVQFSLLEINKKSLHSAKNLIKELKLTAYVKNFYREDAVIFKVPNADTYQILISETLDALLYRECYVPILFNLLPQFNKNIILIPENVLINLTFSSNSNEKEHNYGSVLDVRKAIESINSLQIIPSQLADKNVDLTKIEIKHFEKLILDTKANIYKDIWLHRNESSLTIPLEMNLHQPFKKTSMSFTYYMSPEIELKCSLK